MIVLRIVYNHLGGRSAHLNLRPHLLDLRGLLIETRSELRNCRLKLLILMRHRRL